MSTTPPSDGRSRVLKSPQDFAAGLFLLAFAVLGYYGASNLKFGSLRSIGPGLMPQVMATLLGAFGVFLAVSAFFSRGSLLDRWSLRGVFFVLGAVVLFGLTIRGSEIALAIPPLGLSLPPFKIPALGLAVSGPMAVIVSSFADKSTRWGEVLIFAFVITCFCVALFKYGLRLPIPLAPWLLGY